MNYLVRITFFGLVSGIAGTGIGGLLALSINKISNRLLSFVLEFSGGFMTAVVCFELIPEALSLGGTLVTFAGIFSGIIVVMIIENFMRQLKFFKKNRSKGNNKNNSRSKSNSSNKSNNINLLQTGILMAIGISLHNFPEGFAVGSGFQASVTLGTTVTLAIIIHDIPEGIAMALPMISGGVSKSKALFYTLLSGIPMGIGTLLGALLGGISTSFISVCLGFAGGAMLYIVFVELVPESKKIYLGRLSSIGNLLGIICGIILSVYS